MKLTRQSLHQEWNQASARPKNKTRSSKKHLRGGKFLSFISYSSGSYVCLYVDPRIDRTITQANK